MVQVDSTQVDICLVCGERSLVVWVDQLATWHFMYLVLIQLLQSFLALYFLLLMVGDVYRFLLHSRFV